MKVLMTADLVESNRKRLQHIYPLPVGLLERADPEGLHIFCRTFLHDTGKVVTMRGTLLVKLIDQDAPFMVEFVDIELDVYNRTLGPQAFADLVAQMEAAIETESQEPA